MSEVVVPSYVAVFIYIHYKHTCARESWVFVRCYCAVLWCVQIIKYIFTRRSYSLPHYHHYADLFESELLKWMAGTFCLECVSKIEPILSIIFHAIYEAVRIQVTHLSYDDYENVCTLSYNLHQIGSMTHLPLFRVRSWNNGVRRMPPPPLKMVAVSQTTISNAFQWMESFVFRFKFHWSLSPRVQLTKSQHWYLNQWWPSSPTHICGTKGRLINVVLIAACWKSTIVRSSNVAVFHCECFHCFTPCTLFHCNWLLIWL